MKVLETLVLSDGKLRLGWGQSSNNRVGDFDDAYSTITFANQYVLSINNVPLQGAGLLQW